MTMMNNGDKRSWRRIRFDLKIHPIHKRDEEILTFNPPHSNNDNPSRAAHPVKTLSSSTTAVIS
jgi:hypothetical protein